MFSGKEAANYPTQWALNPTAYQNMDASQVDWASLAQQWIHMKEAAPVGPPAPPPPPVISDKSTEEGGEAPMDVESEPAAPAAPVIPQSQWNAATNTWDDSWNQWGWGWGEDSKVDGLAATGLIDFTADTGYSTTVPPANVVPATTFQQGYWTAQVDTGSRDNKSDTSSKSRRSYEPRPSRTKSLHTHPSNNRGHVSRERAPPLIAEPIIVPAPVPEPQVLDAAKRRQLPAWIREGLEKMEREKARAAEREAEARALAEAEAERLRLKGQSAPPTVDENGAPLPPPKSKFESGSEEEQSDAELPDSTEPERAPAESPRTVAETAPLRSREEIIQEVMMVVRRSLTEILLEVTDAEIHTVSQEELARYNAAQASRVSAAGRSRALSAIAGGLGLGVYASSSDESEGEEAPPRELSDQQLQEVIARRQHEFQRAARDIEAALREAESPQPEPPPLTPHSRPRESVTPPSAPPPRARARLDSLLEEKLRSIKEDVASSPPAPSSLDSSPSSASPTTTSSPSSSDSDSGDTRKHDKQKRDTRATSDDSDKKKYKKRKKDKSKKVTPDRDETDSRTRRDHKHKHDSHKEKRRRRDNDKSSRGRDDDYDKSRKSSRSRDDDYDKSRKSSRSRDDDYDKSRKSSRSRDDEYDKSRKSARHKDADYERSRKPSRSRDDEYSRSRRSSRSRKESRRRTRRSRSASHEDRRKYDDYREPRRRDPERYYERRRTRSRSRRR